MSRKTSKAPRTININGGHGGPGGRGDNQGGEGGFGQGPRVNFYDITARSVTIRQQIAGATSEEDRVLDAIPHADAGYRCVDELKSGLFPGTRQELFEELNNWLDDPGPRPVYFLSGGAGLGKSSIAHQLCTRLDNSTDGPGLGTSFFFVRGSGDLESARLFFSSLAHQLALSQPSLRSRIISAAREYLKHGLRQQMKHSFEELFRGPFQGTVVTLPSSVVLVIDGLDECKDRELIPDLLELLLELPTILPGIRLFLASRPEPHIQSVLTSASTLPSILYRSLNDTVAQWKDDVRLYLKQTVPKIGPYGDFLRDSPDQLEQLINRAAGVFIFARVAVRFLDTYRDHPDPGEQFTLLLSPGGIGLSALDALYLQILSSAFPPPDWNIPPRATTTGSDGILRIAKPISLRKADIIWMTDRLRSVLLINSSGSVIPLHATFSEFLLDPQRCVHTLYHVDRAAGNSLLASACMGTFTFQIISDYLFSGQDAPIRDYVHYAKSNWDLHLSTAHFNGSLKRDLIHFVDHQILVYMRVDPSVWFETVSWSLEQWFSKGAEDGTLLIIENAKSKAYHWLMWAVFIESRSQFPDASAAPPPNGCGGTYMTNLPSDGMRISRLAKPTWRDYDPRMMR
ncbi:hypothetical protein FB45DRAFT_1066467 [Roridomyces roridus]|uniref:NACHT domain-containing protein n=1 Tax=Roridomyces roridus TaxID=1738132 RepID=A0AAD7B511_9AGAR|nr:hypothetical protein FB45DRAFT_1066467 [Roridomyces roridus]